MSKMTPEEMREKAEEARQLCIKYERSNPAGSDRVGALSTHWLIAVELCIRQDAVLEELRLLREAVERIDIPSPLHPPIPMVWPNPCGPPSARHT